MDNPYTIPCTYVVKKQKRKLQRAMDECSDFEIRNQKSWLFGGKEVRTFPAFSTKDEGVSLRLTAKTAKACICS